MGGITPEHGLKIATSHSKKADLALVLGSSMTVIVNQFVRTELRRFLHFVNCHYSPRELSW